MKTAMQELIDDLKYQFSHSDNHLQTIVNIVQKAEDELFEKEKEQIIEAYCDGYKEGSEGNIIMSEVYYIETYNQNKLIINTNGKVGLSNPDETTNNKLTINK